MNQVLVNLIAGSSLLSSVMIFLNPNKYNIAGNRWLGLFVFCVFLLNIDECLYFNNIYCEHIKFYAFSLYCIVPVFYFTIIYFIKPDKKWKPLYYLHFIFGLLFVILEQNSTQIVQGNMVINTTVSSGFLIYFNQFLMYIVLPLQLIVYLSQCFIEITKHNQNIKKFSSNTNEISLKWLKDILYIIISFSFFYFIYIFTQSAVMINLSLFIALFFISYNSIRQKEIFPYSDNSKKEIRAIIFAERNQKSKKKMESSPEDSQKFENLLRVMQTEKLFLNTNLSLFSLANRLAVSAHNLSFIINEFSGENFNQFINRYRVEEAQKMIINSKNNHLSILGIGYEVGFNSKSAFNTTFKKVTNQTPNEFKKANFSQEN